MVFNINELMVFGIPIIYNPIMLIPFLSVPLVCYTCAYFAVSVGLVPMITHSVAWTSPMILSGYTATGSISGAVLQLFNVALGVLIYLPFVRILDSHSERETQELFKPFLDYYRSHEQELELVRLTDMHTVFGDFARGLCAELRHSMGEQTQLFYQPQYHYDGTCIGVEALLRWKHPTHGIIYPPSGLPPGGRGRLPGGAGGAGSQPGPFRAGQGSGALWASCEAVCEHHRKNRDYPPLPALL